MMAGATWTRAARLACALAERYGRRRAAPSLADLVLQRLRPLVRVQAWHRHARVLIAPRVTVAVVSAPVRNAIGAKPPAAAGAAAPPVMRIVARLSTRMTRVDSVQSATRPPLAGVALEQRAAPAPASPLRAVPATRILARARPAEGPGRRPLEPRTESGGVARPDAPRPAAAWPAAPPPAMPPLDLARLTDRLARELGQRVLAYRERLGRR
jgi:hypothetical protein